MDYGAILGSLLLLFKDPPDDGRGVFAGVLDKPDMGIHAAAHHAGQVEVGHIAFHALGEVGRIPFFIIGKFDSNFPEEIKIGLIAGHG